MYTKQTSAIERLIQELRELMGGCTMLSIAQIAATEFWLLLQKGPGGVDMHSPYRQICHLLGLALTSKERKDATSMTKEQWAKAKSLSSNIFEQYCRIYFTPPSSEEEVHKTEVTMGTFLQYIGGPPLRSEDQWEERISALYVPFDNVLLKELGWSASHFLQLLSCVRTILQRQFRDVLSHHRTAKESHRQFVAEWDVKGWSEAEMLKEIKRHPIDVAVRKYTEAVQRLWFLDRKELDEEIGADVMDRMLSCLGTNRTLSAKDYRYITDPSPAEKYPFLNLPDKGWFCATHSLLHHAAELHFDPILSRGDVAQKFFESRDAWVENRVAKAFRTFLGNEGCMWQGICETSAGQFEHDVVVQIEQTWIVAEVKASPLRRSLFDPSRAFIRIRDDFNSDCGIQKSYEQGERLRQALLSSRPATFFNIAGKVVIEQTQLPKDVFVLCVTGEFWGHVAIDLSLLLKKPDNAPYPWAVCVDDLETFLSGLKAKGKGIVDFLNFLRQRTKLHGCSFAEDELNICGYFLEHAGLPAPSKDPKEQFLFTPENSTVFDEIYFEKLGTPLKRDRKQELQKYLQGLREFTEKVAPDIDLSERLRVNASQQQEVNSGKRKIGRNEPCPCGSGLKYKKCCGH